MFSPNGRDQGLAEPIRLFVSAHQRGGGENRGAAAGATSLHNPNARQRASCATAVLVDRAVVDESRRFRSLRGFERNGDVTPADRKIIGRVIPIEAAPILTIP